MPKESLLPSSKFSCLSRGLFSDPFSIGLITDDKFATLKAMSKTKLRFYLAAGISFILGVLTFGFSKTVGVSASADLIWLTDKLPVFIIASLVLFFISALLLMIGVSVKR